MNPEELKAIQNVSEMLSESQQDFFKLKVSSKHVLFQVQSSLFNSLGGFAIALIAFGLTLGFLELGYYILLPTISLICLLILSSSWQREIIDGSEADLKAEEQSLNKLVKETKEKIIAAKEGGDIKVLTDFMLIKQEEMTEEKKNKKNGHFMVYAGEIFNFLSNFGILGILLYFLDQHQSVEHIYGTACLIIISFAISFYDWSEKLINLLSKYFFHPYFKK